MQNPCEDVTQASIPMPKHYLLRLNRGELIIWSRFSIRDGQNMVNDNAIGTRVL